MLPTLTCRVAWTTADPFSAAPVWEDITDDLISFSIKRGRNSELDRMEAGTATVIINNASGGYWWELNPNTLPLKRINLRATYNAVTYDLFTGFIESYRPAFQAPTTTYLQLSCVDLTKNLSRLLLNDGAGYAQELSGTRVANVLTDLGWLGGSDLDLGIGTMQATGALENTNALDHLYALQDSEAGIIYIAGDGDVQFEDRHHRGQGVHLISQATFGSGGNHRYHKADISFDDQFIYNDVRVQRQGGVEQAAENLASQAIYGKRSLTKSQLLFTTDNEALAYAQHLCGRYSDPYTRVDNMVIEPEADEPNLYPFVLGFDISTRITLRIDHAFINQDYFIEGVSHFCPDSGPWRTTWQLSRASAYQVWLLGVAGYSELGSTTVLSF